MSSDDQDQSSSNKNEEGNSDSVSRSRSKTKDTESIHLQLKSFVKKQMMEFSFCNLYLNHCVQLNFLQK